MILSIFHIITAYYIGNIFSYKKFLLPSILIGSIIPDMDIVLAPFLLIFFTFKDIEILFLKTFSHNIFFALFIYLIINIINELKKNNLQYTASGITLGILIHLFLDVLVSLDPINIFWPLPIKSIDIWHNTIIPNNFTQLIMLLEFILFGWYAWLLIKKHLNNPSSNSWIVTYLNQWKKFELYFFLILLLVLITYPANFYSLYITFYIITIIISLGATHLSIDSLDLSMSNN